MTTFSILIQQDDNMTFVVINKKHFDKKTGTLSARARVILNTIKWKRKYTNTSGNMVFVVNEK